MFFFVVITLGRKLNRKKVGCVQRYVEGRKKRGNKRGKFPQNLLGDSMRLPPKKIELVWATEGRNARN